MTKAAIVGWAWRTALGNNVDEVFEAMLAGHSAINTLDRFAPHSYACKLGAALPEKPSLRKHRKFTRRMDRYGIEAAHEAFEMSGCNGGERTGVFVGFGGLRAHWDEIMPSLKAQQTDKRQLWDRGFKRFHPFWMLKHLSNNAHALFAIDINAQGEGITCGGSNAGASAIATAIRALNYGTIDTAIVFTYDSLLQPDVLVEMAAHNKLSKATSISDSTDIGFIGPYDQAAAGAIPGEAAAALVLKRPEDAKGRVLSLLEACEAADGQQHTPSPQTLERSLQRLLGSSFDPTTKYLLDGASVNLPEYDLAERKSLAKFLSKESPLCSSTSVFGRTGATQSILQTISLTKCLQDGTLPPIQKLSDPSDGPLQLSLSKSSHTLQQAIGITTSAPGLIGLVKVELE